MGCWGEVPAQGSFSPVSQQEASKPKLKLRIRSSQPMRRRLNFQAMPVSVRCEQILTPKQMKRPAALGGLSWRVSSKDDRRSNEERNPLSVALQKHVHTRRTVRNGVPPPVLPSRLRLSAKVQLRDQRAWGQHTLHLSPGQLQRSSGIRVGEKPRNSYQLLSLPALREHVGPGWADPGMSSSAGVTGRDPSNSRLCTTVFPGTEQQPPRAPCHTATESRVTTSGVYLACLQSH